MAPVHQAVLVAGSRLADQRYLVCMSLLQSNKLTMAGSYHCTAIYALAGCASMHLPVLVLCGTGCKVG